jgi:PRTRC genetic system protein A
MALNPLKLIGHMLMEQPTLPAIPWPRGYVIARNGIFAWARREGLEALILVATPPAPIGGLYPARPYVRLAYPPVDVWLVSEMLRLAKEARSPEGSPVEILFYLSFDSQRGWQLTVPAQEREVARVAPHMDAFDRALYADTLIEIHSHHRMLAFFSGTDTADEQGFRLYGVLGRVDGETHHVPEIRLRIGIYGHFWEIPAASVLALPAGVTDCVVREQWDEKMLWLIGNVAEEGSNGA